MKYKLLIGTILGIALSIGGVAYASTLIQNNQLANPSISGVALGGSLNALTISAPLTGTSYNGSGAVSIGCQAASGSQAGCLSSTDWTTFNNKGNGSVTSVAETVPGFLSVSGSPITTSGTLAISYSGTALPIANGGTNAVSFGTSNGLVSYNGASLTSYAGYTLSSTLFTAANATTTQVSAASGKFYVAPTGEQTGYDTIHSWSGRVTPTKNWIMGVATSTSWLATSTAPYNLNAVMVLPFTGTLKQAVCSTNAGTLTGLITIGAANYYITGISATPATTTLNAALAEGAKVSFNAGNPASSPQSVSCTMYAVISP